MVDFGANVNATDNDGKTPYNIAVEDREEEVAEYLLTMKLNKDDISEDEIKLVAKVELIFDVLNNHTYY